MKNLGQLHYFLGIELKHYSLGLLLLQHRYITSILHRFKLEKCKPMLTLLHSKLDWNSTSSPLLENPSIYRQMVGNLLYLSFTRPDIQFAVNLASQFLHQPRQLHFQAVKRIFRRSTTRFCIFLGSNLISWYAKKQPTVARSSTEAEYRALAIATAEATWLQYILRDLGVFLTSPVSAKCDNI
nr:uncharacterized mitochondrial protein AtMg00810-like [Nicotiana tomentosiformis]